MKTFIARLLCKIGLHRWSYGDLGYSKEIRQFGLVETCVRCGKHRVTMEEDYL